MEPIQREYERWLARAAEDPQLIGELRDIAGREDEIEDRFYRQLSFGTGGMRGVIGAGPNRMNLYTVRRATLGLARYIGAAKAQPAHSEAVATPHVLSVAVATPHVLSVAVAFDSRIKSQLFARETARVLATAGLRVYLYPSLMPTPALSFAVRRMGCAAGVMITASHNPAVYNGYKVYGADGCQITLRAAEEILARMETVDVFDGLPCRAEGELRREGLIAEMPPEVAADYCAAVLAQRLEERPAAELSVVYTPLNGTGLVPVLEVLERAGYRNVAVVPSQREPDGTFPTCPYPNPEIPAALEEGLALCRERGADLLLATDPDCDRVGVAVRHGGAYRLLTGNEVGVLLLDYVCSARAERGKLPENAVAVKTVVTTNLARKVAERWGVEVRNVLTGFKFIGEQIGELERAGEEGRYVFGFEESCGYLSGTHVRDKDGVNAVLLVCDLAARCKARGSDLAQALEELYEAYGYWLSGLRSYTFAGARGFGQMQERMARLRARPPEEIGGQRVCRVVDYLYEEGARPAGGLPSSDVLQFALADETEVTVRPSGTEPKLKVYVCAVRPGRREAEAALAACQDAVEALVGPDADC